MNIDNKFSRSTGHTQLRSTSQKVIGEITPWPELEVLSREKLVQRIYKDNRAGSWTIGSKVSLICRVHCLQQTDFVFSRRNELEALSLQEYRLWRLNNESLLGSELDPDSSKYFLAPPNLFTGEYLYFGFEVLMALKKETLIEYIRDHFCGYSTNLLKGRLACRIRVLLRFPRDVMEASDLAAYEDEQFVAFQNYFSNMEVVKAEEKQSRQRAVVDKETKQKQPLITGSFTTHIRTKRQCISCKGEIAGRGPLAQREKCSYCSNRESATVRQGSGGPADSDDKCVLDGIPREVKVGDEHDSESIDGVGLEGQPLGGEQVGASTGAKDLCHGAETHAQTVSSTPQGLEGEVRDQGSAGDSEVTTATESTRERAGNVSDKEVDQTQDAVKEGGGCEVSVTEMRQDQMRTHSVEFVSAAVTREGLEGKVNRAEAGLCDSARILVVEERESNKQREKMKEMLQGQVGGTYGTSVLSGQLGSEVELKMCNSFESFDPMLHRKQTHHTDEEFVLCCVCKDKMLVVISGSIGAKCVQCTRKSGESMDEVSSARLQGGDQSTVDGTLPMVTGDPVTLSGLIKVTLEHGGHEVSHLELGAKISEVLREIEKSNRDSSLLGESADGHRKEHAVEVESARVSHSGDLVDSSMGVTAATSLSHQREVATGDIKSSGDSASGQSGGRDVFSQMKAAGISDLKEEVGLQASMAGRENDGVASLMVGSMCGGDPSGGAVVCAETKLQLEGSFNPVDKQAPLLEGGGDDGHNGVVSASCERLKSGVVQSVAGGTSTMVGSGNMKIQRTSATGRGTGIMCDASVEWSTDRGQYSTLSGDGELHRLAMMYSSASEDEDGQYGAQVDKISQKTSVASNRLANRSPAKLALVSGGLPIEQSKPGIPVPVVGMGIPSWDMLLRGRTAAELRGYIQTHFPHVNVECSTPIVAAKIRILLEHMPAAVNNEELDVLVRNDGDGYKEWYQSSVLGKSTSSVTMMTADGSKAGVVDDMSPRTTPSRFPAWADISSDDDEAAAEGPSEEGVPGCSNAEGDSLDRKFMLAARLVLLGEGENKEDRAALGDFPALNSPTRVEKGTQPVGGTVNANVGGIKMAVPMATFSLVVVPVEAEWVGAAAYMEYSRLVTQQPAADVGGRSRGLLLSSMSAAMRIVTGHEFSTGPCHAAILEKRHLKCVEGWSARLINLASASMGEAIRLEIGEEKSQTVEFVFELYYRHFFSRPNRFHFRYGAVFAVMHGYQLQIWTGAEDHQYLLVETYGSGAGVSRWLVRDVTTESSHVELLLETTRVQMEGFDVHGLGRTNLHQCREQLLDALESSGGEGGVNSEGCFLPMAELLVFGRGGQVPDCIMAAWSRVCQRVNSARYILSSKTKEYIDSVWFLPPTFFHSVLIQADGAIVGYDVLGFPTLLTDVERLRAKILLVPYCPQNGRWGAGILHIRERDVGYLEHGHSYSLHPGTALFLQALREWFDYQYAMKYDVSLIASTAEAWSITHELGSEAIGLDDYDSGAQLLLEMLILAMGTQESREVTRAQLDQFRWYVIAVLALPDVRRDQWVQDVSYEICEPAALQEMMENLSGGAKTASVYAVIGDNGSTHQFDFRCAAEKTSENALDVRGPMLLAKVPVRLLFELSQVLTERFSYAEVWLVEHHLEYKRIVQSMIAPAGAALGANDFSVRALASLLEAEIFVESGAPIEDITFLTCQVTLDWWLWANLCSRRKFCTLMSVRFPEMVGSHFEEWWRRTDIDRTKFTLVRVVSDEAMQMEAPILGFLGKTFPVVMRLLMKDLDESSPPQSLYRLGTSMAGVLTLHSLAVEQEICAESCSLRMRDSAERLQVFLRGVGAYALEGGKVTSPSVVKMSRWKVCQSPGLVGDQFDMLMFAVWWRSNMVCDICWPGVKVDLHPLEVLMMLERLEVESKVVHSMSVDLKHVHLFRSLKVKLVTSVNRVATEVMQSVDRVMELLLDKRVAEAREVWRTTMLDGEDVGRLCREIFPKVTREGRWGDQAVYIDQTLVPMNQVIAICTAVDNKITVGIPNESLFVVLHAMDRQVMHAAVLHSNYGISAEVSLGKYWSMPRGISISWLHEGKRMDEVMSRKELLRRVLASRLDEARPLWMVLGITPRLDMMVRLSHVDGASFSQSEITSVRCRDSLRTLVASDRVSVISFSHADSDYPLGIVGSYGRRTLDSMSKDPSSVVAKLVQQAKEGRSLDLFTVDHYNTPAEYSTKTLRSMFSVLQWLSEHKIVSTQTTIEFKNVRASEMTDAFYALLGKDFATSRVSIDCSPWVEMSRRYAEWLRRRGVRVADDMVIGQFRDSVPDQEVLRLKWQGQNIPQLPLQDTDITESQLSALGFNRFGAECDGKEAEAVEIVESRARLLAEVKTMRYGHAGVEISPWQTGKSGKNLVLARVYPVEVVDPNAELLKGKVLFTTLYSRISGRLRYKVMLQHSSRTSEDLCSSVAAMLGWPRVTCADMMKVVLVMLEQIASLPDLVWKWRVVVEANLSSLQQTLDNGVQGMGSNGVTVWQQYGNLGLFESGTDQVSEDEFREQVAFLETFLTALCGRNGTDVRCVRVAFRVDENFIIFGNDVTCGVVQDMLGGILCVMGSRSEETVYQLIDISAEMGGHIIKGMQECAHTLAEAMVTQSSWRDHSLAWYHKEWKLRARWVQLVWKEIRAMDICNPPWRARKSRGREELARGMKRTRDTDNGLPHRGSSSPVDLYALCKSDSHVTRLGFTESILADRIVVSGFHASCTTSDVIRQIEMVLKLAQIPAEDSQIQRGVSQGGSETSTGLKMYIIQLRRSVQFRTRLDKGTPYFFSLMSDPIQVTYGKSQRRERFMVMVSPCPRWITDLRQPAFVSRGHSGVDVADMFGVGALGWTCRRRFPAEVGEMAFVRVQIRVGFLVSTPGSSSSSLLRHANETIVLHFSTGGVQQLSLWSWLERQKHWKVEPVHVPKQGKSGRISLRESGLRYDLWKSYKHIIGSGYDHILASADVVGPRAVTILSCRKGASPTDESFSQLLQLWESQAVNLSAISTIGWVSSKFEGAKGRKRAHSRPSHISIAWAGDTPEDVQIAIPELPGSQLDMEVVECVEGMWRSSFGLDGHSVSFLPGNIRSYFMMRGQTLLPKRNAIINDLLGSGWGSLLDIPQSSVSFSQAPPLRSALKRSFSYAAVVEERTGLDREETSITTQESASAGDPPDESRSLVSTLSSKAGDDKVWQEISKLRADIEKIQRMGDSSALVQAMEERVQHVEAATRVLQTQQEQTSEVLSEVKRDGKQVAQAVDRMEGCMGEIRDLLQRQSQALPPMWMNPTPMLEYYRAQMQLASVQGLAIQDGQRLHGALKDQSSGADKVDNNG